MQSHLKTIHLVFDIYRKIMTQHFNIFDCGKATAGDPYKKFAWYEDDEGYEKYGYLFSASVSGCLHQIKEYIDFSENDFEIHINLSDKFGGDCVVKTLKELESARLKYNQISLTE